jgi:hypothetical protein
MNAPIFIVGANRSGTTLLRLLLNAHSQVAIPDEINYFNSFRHVRYARWSDPDLSAAQFEDFVDAFLRTNQPVTPELDLDALRAEILEGPVDLRRPYKLLLEAWARHHGKPRWGEKTPGNVYNAHFIMSMFPDALFVQIVRDPRAVVHSMQKVSFFPDDVVFNAFNLRKALAEGRSHVERMVPASQRLTVRYEDLVNAPVPTLRRVCAFAGLAYEDGMLAFHQDASRYMTAAAASSFNTTATRPISKDRTDAWRDHLSGPEVRMIEHIHEAFLTEFGYVPQGGRLSPWRWSELAVKGAYWQYHRRRNRHVPQYMLQHNPFGALGRRVRRWTAPLRHRLFPLSRG